MSHASIHLRAPLDDGATLALHSGDAVLIDGVMYTARDAAHERLIASLNSGEPLPFELKGQIIYYVGPAPARPGRPIGSAGPTTSGRMDRYTPALYEAGLRATVGKGFRSRAVREAVIASRGVYLAAVGGSGALLSRTIRSAEVVAYGDLGPEAIFRLEVHDFPAIVINDCHGGDLYESAKQEYGPATATHVEPGEAS